MKYRTLGRTGLEVSEIGMGLEHLLDKEENIVAETIRSAINGGVNYFDCLLTNDFAKKPDTNEHYVKLGKALEGVRDKVYITYIANALHSVDDTDQGFECFLRELKTDHTDVFIIACCDKISEFERVTGKGSLFKYAENIRAEGKAKYIGLSTHNTEIAYKVIESGAFDVLMYPVNPAFDVIDDEEKYNSDILGNIWDEAYNYTSAGKSGVQPRRNIYIECERNGIGLVAMKPFAGGFILSVEKDAGFTPLNLISYALNQTGVSTVIPGCSNPQEIEEILTYYTCPRDALDYGEAMSKSRWSLKGNCQYCSHCLPCPANINIAQVNRLADGVTGSDKFQLLRQYSELAVKPSACIGCGECEKRCPFQVEIVNKMKSAAEIFGDSDFKTISSF